MNIILTERELSNLIKNIINEASYDEVDKYIMKIGKFMKMNFPRFNKDNVTVDVDYFTSSNSFGEKWDTIKNIKYIDNETGTLYCKYWPGEKELQLSFVIFERLTIVFGDDKMTYVIEWFNNEFDENAEYVTF